MNYYNLNKTGGEVENLLNAIAELQASAVKFTPNQGLAPESQVNARDNIGAVSGDYVVEAVGNQISSFTISTVFEGAVTRIIGANITSGLSLATIGYVNDSSRPSFEYVNSTAGAWASNKIYVVPMDGQNKLWVQTTNAGKKEISVVQNAVSTYTPDGCMVTFTPNGFSLDKTQLDPTIWKYTNGYLTNAYLQGEEITEGAEYTQSNFVSNFLQGGRQSGFIQENITINSSEDWVQGDFDNKSFYGNSFPIYLENNKSFFSDIQSSYFQDMNIYISVDRSAPVFAATASNVVFKNVHIYCNSNLRSLVVRCPLFVGSGKDVQFIQCSINNKEGCYPFQFWTTSADEYGFVKLEGIATKNKFSNCLFNGEFYSNGNYVRAGLAVASGTMTVSCDNNVIKTNAFPSANDFAFICAINSSSTITYNTNSYKNLYCITNNKVNESRLVKTTENYTIIKGKVPPTGSYLGQIMYDSAAKQFLIWNGDYWQQIT